MLLILINPFSRYLKWSHQPTFSQTVLWFFCSLCDGKDTNATKMSTLMYTVQSRSCRYILYIFITGGVNHIRPVRLLLIPKEWRLVTSFSISASSLRLTSFSSLPWSSTERCLRSSSRPRAGSLQSLRPCGQSSTRLHKHNRVKNINTGRGCVH